jgi:hypothetical protein
MGMTRGCYVAILMGMGRWVEKAIIMGIARGDYVAVFMDMPIGVYTGIRKLTVKILEVVSLTDNKDEMPFDAPVSSKTFFNVKNVATSRF